MGYKIVYGKENIGRSKQRFWSGRMHFLTVLCLIMFVLSVKMMFREEFTQLRAALLPSTMDGSFAAVEELVSDLRNEVPLKDAVTAFCRQVIADAGIR